MHNTIDVDECTFMTHDCDENAECINTDGSFLCLCNQGYIGNGKTCLQFSKSIEVVMHGLLKIILCFFTDGASCTQVCDQYCGDINMEPVCACDHGYYLDMDNHTCKGNPVANYDIIKLYASVYGIPGW